MAEPTYTVQTFPRAEVDAQCIYDWIFKKSPDGARRWRISFEDACERLKVEALNYSLAVEAEACDQDVRQILFKTPHGLYYRAVFIVKGTTVSILRIRGPGQTDLLSDEMG